MTIVPNSAPRRRLLLALAVLVFLPLAASAQDHPDRTERLKQALDLTDAQVALVQDAVGEEAERGDLWNVAAALAPTLTDAQKTKLFTRPDRPARMQKRTEKRRGHRGDEGQRERPDAAARAERRSEAHAAMKADMQAALDLTDAQVQQLEALHAERRAEVEKLREERRQRRAERPERGALSDDLTAILTPEQQDIARVHRALAAHMMHRFHHRGGRR